MIENVIDSLDCGFYIDSWFSGTHKRSYLDTHLFSRGNQ